MTAMSANRSKNEGMNTMPNKCTDCGSEIWPRYTRCRPCRNKAVLVPHTKCKGCGITFKPRKKAEASYCSRQCAFSHAKEWIAPPNKRIPRKPREKNSHPYKKVWFRACITCGTAFVAKRINHLVCRNKHPRPKQIKQCATCGMGYEAHGSSKYCTVKCRNIATDSGATFTKDKYGMGNREWQRLRMAVLKRDEYRCYICMRTTDPRAHHNADTYPNAEHVVPVVAGGATTMDNLRCACRSCNMAKGRRYNHALADQSQVID